MTNFTDSIDFKKLIFSLNMGNESDYGCVEINSEPAKDDFIKQLEVNCEKEVIEIDFSPISKARNKKNTELVVTTHHYLTIKNFSEKFGEDKIFVITNLRQTIDTSDDESVLNLVVEINMNRENYVRYPSPVLFVFPRSLMDKIFLKAADFISMMAFHFDFTEIERKSLKNESPAESIKLTSDNKIPVLSLKESYIENFKRNDYPLLSRLISANNYIEVCNYYYLSDNEIEKNISDILLFVQNLELTTEKRIEMCVIIFCKIGKYYGNFMNYKKSIEFTTKAIKISEDNLGKEHPVTGSSYDSMAEIYQELGKYEEALSYYLRALNIYLNVLGEKHPGSKIILKNIQGCYVESGRDISDFDEWLQKNLSELNK